MSDREAAPEDPGGRDAAGELGERLGRLAASLVRRIEQVAVGTPSAPATPHAPAASGLPTARAEELLDRMSGQVGAIASVLGHRFRASVARAQEEAEDMWAEAQHLRRDRRQQEHQHHGDQSGRTG